MAAAGLVAGLFGSLPALAAGSEGTPSVTPYRPSVSTPAALSAPGWLEVEVGALRARGSEDSRRDSLPYSLKLAFSEDWGFVSAATHGFVSATMPETD